MIGVRAELKSGDLRCQELARWPGWLLLLAQLPGTPSSARVALWRRLRAIGATSVVNGTWVLPDTAPNRKLFEELQESVRKQNGTGFALIVQIDEIRKEAKAGKYTFAEMEESEQDLEKLPRWLRKIRTRDFFPDERGRQAADLLARCRGAIEGFAQAVYEAEGMQEPGDD